MKGGLLRLGAAFCGLETYKHIFEKTDKNYDKLKKVIWKI